MKNQRLSSVLSELDREFDKKALDWLIGMYDAESGGMYYSASSRDNDQFEPDLESTTQTISLLTNLGLISLDENGVATDVPEWFEKGACDFMRTRQDESDGYFYDPIYKDISPKSKKERNTSFVVEALKTLGASPLYLTATQRLSDTVNTDDSDQAMYATKESYLEWLDKNAEERVDSYHWGSDLSCARPMIIASGNLQTTVDWLKQRQNTQNGTWEDEFNMTAINGVLKIRGYFNKNTEVYPHYDTYIRNTVEFTKTFEPEFAAYAWNPIGSVKRIIEALPTSPDPELASLIENGAADMIANTVVQMRGFRQPDGGFGYSRKGSSPRSNRVTVSLGLPEGDVNALALMALIYTDSYALCGIPNSRVWSKHREYFWSEMKKKYDAVR
jgi:hypothetical protein